MVLWTRTRTVYRAYQAQTAGRMEKSGGSLSVCDVLLTIGLWRETRTLFEAFAEVKGVGKAQRVSNFFD